MTPISEKELLRAFDYPDTIIKIDNESISKDTPNLLEYLIFSNINCEKTVTLECYLGVFEIMWYKYSLNGERYTTIKRLNHRP